MGIYLNGYTNMHLNYFVLYGPKERQREIVENGLALIGSPSLTSDIIGTQKKVIESELLGYMNHFTKNMGDLLDAEILSRKLSYAERLDRLKNITPQAVVEYYNKHYGRANMTFVLAGDAVSESEGWQFLAEHVGRLPL